MSLDWHDAYNSEHAKFLTAQDQIDRVKEKLRSLMEVLGAKERTDGTLDIDFGILVGRLTIEHALDLRREIDEQHRISGASGDKPRVKLAAAQ